MCLGWGMRSSSCTVVFVHSRVRRHRLRLTPQEAWRHSEYLGSVAIQSLIASVIIDPNGQIAFPLAGHITADGLTPQKLEKILKARLQRNYKDGEIDVTVALANAAKPDIPERRFSSPKSL